MKKHIDDGTFEAPIKPECFDLTQDFDTQRHRTKISDGLDCFTDQQKQQIADGNDVFKDAVFGFA